MVNFEDIKSPFTLFLRDMRKDLKRKILKTSKVTGRTYYSNTYATGRLYKSLHTEVFSSDDFMRIKVVGTDYWLEADSGIQESTPPPRTSDLQTWLKVRELTYSPVWLRRKLYHFGFNEPTSKFATRNIDKFRDNLYKELPTAFLRDFTADLDRNLSRIQSLLIDPINPQIRLF